MMVVIINIIIIIIIIIYRAAQRVSRLIYLCCCLGSFLCCILIICTGSCLDVDLIKDGRILVNFFLSHIQVQSNKQTKKNKSTNEYLFRLDRLSTRR